MKTLKLNRTVTKDECPWLKNDLNEGDEVYEYMGCTYGCVTPEGIAVSEKPKTDPFFEIPANSVDEI